MADVFISYNNRDLNRVNPVLERLEKAGIEYWIAPRDIPAGSFYTKEITAAIKSCKVFLLMLSANAQTSKYVIRELDSAFDMDRVIVPLMLEDCALTEAFSLLIKGTQQIIAYRNYEEAMESLISRILQVVGPKETPKKKKEHKYIQCPACGSTKLKEETGFFEKVHVLFSEYLNPIELIREDKLMVLSFAFPIIAAIVYLSSYISMAITELTEGELWKGIIKLLIIILVSFAGICLANAYKWIRRYQIRKHCQIWHFRCCTCDKKFRKIVKEGRKKDRLVQFLVKEK